MTKYGYNNDELNGKGIFMQSFVSLKNNIRSANRLLSAISLCAALTLPANIAQAQIAPSPCDPAYYQSLEQRAWLEAQREITQNQNLIFKPDSVLAYTCFQGNLLELGDHADEMFSENTRWGTDVLGSDQALHMNTALGDLVADALGVYLDGNFTSASDRRFLGGRSTISRPDPSTYTDVPNGGSYTCDVMQQVWDISKCYNFQARTHDGFFTFENYAADTTGKRMLPEPCGGEPTGLYTNAINESMVAPPWPIDTTLTYLDNFDAASCGDPLMPPIATGVIVRRTQAPQQYFEGVCIQPGCHFRPSGGTPSGTPTANGTCVP